MTSFKTFVLALGAPLAALLASPATAQKAVDPVGEWHGSVAASTGDLTLILYVTRGEGGALRAQIESRTLAPGRKAPVDEIASANGHLAFKVTVISATYEGTWNEAAQQWQGNLIQGRPRPFNLSKGVPPPNTRVEGLDGLWEGAVERNGITLRQALRIASGEWGTNALFDSPDQAVTNVPLTDLVRDGQAVRFAALRGVTTFAGTLSKDGTQLAGSWTAPNQPSTTATFTRRQVSAARAPRVRPQTPREPFPYRVEQVAFDNRAASGVRLGGTLTLPEGKGPFPAAVMISGSGGQDRDGTSMGHKLFAVIADHLARNGIAMLRFDDRGVAQSTGDSQVATSADQATDANAAFAYLTTRPEIRHDAIGFIGHSEGGLIGPIAMASNNEVAFLISLAGPATDMLEVLLAQRRLVAVQVGMSEEEVRRSDPVFAALYAAMAKADTPESARESMRAVLTPEARTVLGMTPDQDAGVAFAKIATPWFRYLVKYDPAPNLARIKVPVLALNGSLDVQVPPKENVAAFRKVLKDNPDATVVELPGLNHVFQTARTGAIGEYDQIDETIAPAVLERMSDWIGERFASRKPE